MSSRLAGAALSLALHASLLLGCTPTPPSAAPVPVASPPEAKEASLRFIATGMRGLACTRTYTGVGLESSYSSGRISGLAPGGPAQRAGAQLGDRLLNDAVFSRNQHEVGKKMTLRLEREGRRIDLPVVIDRICVEETPRSRPSTIPHLRD